LKCERTARERRRSSQRAVMPRAPGERPWGSEAGSTPMGSTARASRTKTARGLPFLYLESIVYRRETASPLPFRTYADRSIERHDPIRPAAPTNLAPTNAGGTESIHSPVAQALSVPDLPLPDRRHSIMRAFTTRTKDLSSVPTLDLPTTTLWPSGMFRSV